MSFLLNHTIKGYDYEVNLSSIFTVDFGLIFSRNAHVLFSSFRERLFTTRQRVFPQFLDASFKIRACVLPHFLGASFHLTRTCFIAVFGRVLSRNMHVFSRGFGSIIDVFCHVFGHVFSFLVPNLGEAAAKAPLCSRLSADRVAEVFISQIF